MQNDTELIIIGGGPAGIAAGVYAARKQLKTTLVTKDYGGQSIVSSDIQNWIGTPHISGSNLAKSFKDHLNEYAGDFLNVVETEVLNVKKNNSKFIVSCKNNIEYTSSSLFIASGANRRKLDIEGADEFDHKGVTYCASCDGPFFTDKDVVVVGGGNAGFETAAQLLAYTKSVTLLHKNDKFKADPITVENVLKNSKMNVITNANIKIIKGDTLVNAIIYEKDNKMIELHTSAVFVEIGLIPSTDFLKDLVELDSVKRIIVDPMNQGTSDDMIWAAGDCSNGIYHQNNIAAGDAVKALENIYLKIKS